MSSLHQNLSDYQLEKGDDTKRMRFAVIASEWNADICNNLLEGAINVLSENGVEEKNVKIIRVPGSYELSSAASLALKSEKFDALICLGCVIKGETRHDQYISQAVASSLSHLSMMASVPVLFGVVTTENLEQAKARSGGDKGNKGIEAAVTAIKMVRLKNELLQPKSNIGFGV